MSNPQQGNVFTGVAMCVPLAGRPVPAEWAFAFKGMDPPINFNMMHMSTIKMKVDEARNFSAQWALDQKCKYLFFLGDDVVPPSHVLRRFIYIMENNPEIDVVSGVYFTKSDPSVPLVFRGNGAGSYWNWTVGEFFWVTGCGMDCCCIRTSVFEKMRKPWFQTIKADTYAEDIPKTEVWTEDLYFCDQLEKQLGKNPRRIWVDASIICDHWDVSQMKKYSIPWNCLPATRQFSHGKKKILDLGCGMQKFVHKDGIPTRVDIREECNPDYRCDLRLLPFKDESWDIVRSSHVMEHFSRADVSELLDEWIRVLKVGGEMEIVVPNLEFAAHQILEKGLTNDGMNVLYGQQEYAENFHKCGFTPHILKEMLLGKGLKVKRIWTEKPYNLLAEAKKVTGRTGVGDGQGRTILKEEAEKTVKVNAKLIADRNKILAKKRGAKK